MRKITAELLAAKGACPDHLDEFRERFPNGLDPATVRPEEVAYLNVEWAVDTLLPGPAWRVYWKAIAPGREAWGAGATSWEAYEEAQARAAIELFRQYWSYAGEEAGE